MKALGALAGRARRRRAAPRSTPPSRRSKPRCAARRAELADARARERSSQAEALDVTLPGRSRGTRRLHPVSAHAGAHRADLRVDGLRRGRRPRDRDRLVQLHRAEQPGEPSGAFDAGHVLRRRQGRRRPLLNLRPHTSPMQVRYAQRTPKHAGAATMPDIRVIAPGRTYRVDSDATHSPMFHQGEGLWIGENVSFKRPEGRVPRLLQAFFETDDLQLRFRPCYFPFTEPSAEIDMHVRARPARGPLARGLGLRARCTRHVVRNMGLDPNASSASRSASGLDRLTMLRYGVDDLRLFFDGDLRFLRQFRLDRAARRCNSPNPGCASSAIRRSARAELADAAHDGRPRGRRPAPGRAAVPRRRRRRGAWKSPSTRTPTACACARSTSARGDAAEHRLRRAQRARRHQGAVRARRRRAAAGRGGRQAVRDQASASCAASKARACCARRAS